MKQISAAAEIEFNEIAEQYETCSSSQDSLNDTIKLTVREEGKKVNKRDTWLEGNDIGETKFLHEKSRKSRKRSAQ